MNLEAGVDYTGNKISFLGYVTDSMSAFCLHIYYTNV